MPEVCKLFQLTIKAFSYLRQKLPPNKLLECFSFQLVLPGENARKRKSLQGEAYISGIVDSGTNY